MNNDLTESFRLILDSEYQDDENDIQSRIQEIQYEVDLGKRKPDCNTLDVFSKIESELSDIRNPSTSIPVPPPMFKQWKCVILEVYSNKKFMAEIKSVSLSDRSTKVVTFNLDKVKVANEVKLKIGTVFYWTVGIFYNSKRMAKKRSEIRFQMLPPLTTTIINQKLVDIGDIYDGLKWME